MIHKGVKKYLIDPALGLLASILYMLLFWITRDIFLSLIISGIFSAIGDIAIRTYSKTFVCGMIFLINFIAFSITFIIWLFLKDVGHTNMFYIVVYEMLFFTLLIISRLLELYITNLHLRQNKSNPSQKTFLSEYFEIAKLTQYCITIHLFIIIIYRYIHENIEIDEPSDSLFYFGVPVIFASSIIIYHEVKMGNIIKHLRKEEWLPIVNESGEVTGRIAKSVSDKMKNRFMHPVVRVVLVHDGEIYLQKRSSDDTFDPGSYDHPFEKHMLFNHEINISVKNSISRVLNKQDLSFNFLLKYVYEDENTKRLIFLFVSRIGDEEQLESIKVLNGKFWTMKQIEDSFSDNGIFSNCFQLEYEYLKNTILQPEFLKKQLSGIYPKTK